MYFYVIVLLIAGFTEFVCIPTIVTHSDDIELNKYESFESGVYASQFENSDDSTIFMSFTPNDWSYAQHFNPASEGKYVYSYVKNIVLKDDLIYAADSQRGLDIYNISDQSNIQYVSGYEIEKAYDIAVNESYAYVQSLTKMLILNIESPSTPVLLSEYDTINAKKIMFDNDLAYILDPPFLEIVNVSDKSNPRRSSRTLVSSFPKDLQLRDGFLYVAGTDLRIFDVRNPSFPNKTVTEVTNQLYGISVSVFPTAYMGTDFDLLIYDISNPYDPQEINSIVSENRVGKVWVDPEGMFLYVCEEDYGLVIYNISDPTSPILISSTELKDNGDKDGVVDIQVDVTKNISFLAQEKRGLKIVDTANISHPIVLRTESPYVGGNANKMFLWDGKKESEEQDEPAPLFLAVSDSEQGVSVFDVSSNYLEPRWLGKYKYETEKMATVQVTADDDYLFIADSPRGFLIVNYTYDTLTKTMDFELVYENDIEMVRRVLLMDDGDGNRIAYVTSYYQLTVLNLSDLSNVSELAVFEETAMQNVIVTEEKTLYYHTLYDGMTMLDVSDPSNIVGLGEVSFLSDISIESMDYKKIFVEENNKPMEILAAIGARAGGTFLELADVSNRTCPISISTFLLSGPYGLDQDVLFDPKLDTVLYVMYDGGFQVIDISDFDDLEEIEGFLLDDTCGESMVVRDNTLYLSYWNLGIKTFKMDIAIKPKDNFEYFCGTTVLKIVAKDATGEVTDSFDLFREDYCSGRGECLIGDACECFDDYHGEHCEVWSCYTFEYTQTTKTCSGRGECVEPDVCECDPNYVGDDCSTNVLYGAVMAPLLSIFFSIVGVLGLCLCCAVCCCCCMGCVALCLSLFACSLVVVKQSIGIKKFGRLKNFDLLLKEQEMENDSSVAHLKISKTLFEVDMDEIKTMSILGEGGSTSIVFKATWKGQVVAFKCFKTRQLMTTQDRFDEFEKEVQILSSISHPNIIRFFGACLKPPRVGIVMEFCSKGELFQFLTDFRNEYFTEFPILQKIRMLIEVCSALEYLHSKNIIHRDLKCENVLITENDTSKLMDFGLSKTVDHSTGGPAKTKRIGTNIYISPEMINSADYDEKCDVFSFGILSYIVLTENEKPYSDIAQHDFNIELRVANDETFRPRIGQLDRLSEDFGWLKPLIQNCWEHDPHDRYSCKEIREIMQEKGSLENYEKVQSKSAIENYNRTVNVNSSDSAGNDDSLEEYKKLVLNLRQENSGLKEVVLQLKAELEEYKKKK